MTNYKKDPWFLQVCNAIASESKCLSRKIGAIIVLDGSIVSTGYNGPPRGVKHCDQETGHDVCPRRLLGLASGQGIEFCPASHAEVNAIANAARLGVSCNHAALYLNTLIPCKGCAALIINAGIEEVICADLTPYDTLGVKLLAEAEVVLRKFTVS